MLFTELFSLLLLGHTTAQSFIQPSVATTAALPTYTPIYTNNAPFIASWTSNFDCISLVLWDNYERPDRTMNKTRLLGR